MLSKFLVGLALKVILDLVIRDYPDSKAEFRRLTSDWLTDEESDKIYDSFWDLFNLPIVEDEYNPFERSVETSQPPLSISDEEGR